MKKEWVPEIKLNGVKIPLELTRDDLEAMILKYHTDDGFLIQQQFTGELRLIILTWITTKKMKAKIPLCKWLPFIKITKLIPIPPEDLEGLKYEYKRLWGGIPNSI